MEVIDYCRKSSTDTMKHWEKYIGKEFFYHHQGDDVDRSGYEFIGLLHMPMGQVDCLYIKI